MAKNVAEEYAGCLDKYLNPSCYTDGKQIWLSTKFERYNVSMLTTGEILDVYPVKQCPYCNKWIDLVSHAISVTEGNCIHNFEKEMM